MASDGDTAVVGAYRDDDKGTNSGSAYVFVRSGTAGRVGGTAARAANGMPSFAALDAAVPGMLAALFVPEHGLTANQAAGEDVPSGWLRPGIPVHSLYAAGRQGPLPEHLAKLDLLVIDLPDIGSRYYTYPATMINCIRVCVSRSNAGSVPPANEARATNEQ